MNKLKQELEQYGEVQENVSFQTMTTLRIGGYARYVVYPKTTLALTQIIREVKDACVPFKVIGKGSNLLCSDHDFNGVVIRLDRTFTDFYFDHDVCYAEAGCSIIAVAYETIKQNLGGLEFASGIPGTVGGVTFMNAGAYKCNMADIIQEVFIYRDGRCEWVTQDECNFDYRYSIFHDHPDWIILAIKMKLFMNDAQIVRELIENRRQRRLETQPLNFPSAGSVFRNLPDNPAWYYIDALGWRGKKVGGAMISEKHANFIVNIGNATACDFLCLVEQIQVAARQRFQVELIMEVERFNW